MEGDWAGVLENAEQAMSLPCGIGWLDLQRYAVRACESLGSDYEPVAAGIRAESKTLLADYPDLLTSHSWMTHPPQTPNAKLAQRKHFAATSAASNSGGSQRTGICGRNRACQPAVRCW